MRTSPTSLPDVLIFEPRVVGDERGEFFETFRHSVFTEATGTDLAFVQDNHSVSRHGVLRGLHCQTRKPQGKLVRCIRGEVFDVAVDIRPGSDSFGQWVGMLLSADNRRQLYIPPGFAHGFQVVSETAEIVYKCTDYYDPGGESGLIWNDPDVGIEWPLPAPDLSAKDRLLPSLEQIRRGD